MIDIDRWISVCVAGWVGRWMDGQTEVHTANEQERWYFGQASQVLVSGFSLHPTKNCGRARVTVSHDPRTTQPSSRSQQQEEPAA